MILPLVLVGAVAGGALGVALRGRRYLADREPLGWWSVAVAAAAAAAATGLLAWRVDDPWVLLVGCIFVVGGVAASWTDLDAHLLLDAVTWPLAGALLAAVTAAAFGEGIWGRWWTAVGAAGAVAGVLLLWAIFGSLGLGDVKLGLSVGLALGFSGGWAGTLRGFLIALVLAALLAIGLLVAGRSRKALLPLGPALVVGVLVSLAW